MDIPEPESKHGIILPYVLVSDEIFSLKPWLMKPYPGKGLPESKDIFNYRLSRCRRIIENTLQQNEEFSEDQFVQTLKQWKRQ